MNNPLLGHPRLLAFGIVLLAAGCDEPEEFDTGVDAVENDDEVDAVQIDGVWVFTYSETPSLSMQALASGEAAVVDGCLQMGDAVVIWHDEHLGIVEEILQRIDAGETINIQVGGGGLSLDEGSTLDDFPDGVLEHCAPAEIWLAASEAPTFASER